MTDEELANVVLEADSREMSGAKTVLVSRALWETAVAVARALLARKPAWTKEPPTVPGWYWRRAAASAYEWGDGPYIVSVFRDSTNNGELSISRSRTIPISQIAYGEWCGPLSPP